MSSKEKTLLFLAIYIFSFIFMSFGGAFSYFSARTRSHENALDAKSGHLSLGLEIKAKYAGHDLIPIDDKDIMIAYNKECKDNKDKGVCLAYDIFITNNSVRQDVTGNIDFELDHIENLSYLVMDENGNVYQETKKVSGTVSGMPLGNNFILDTASEEAPITKKFTLLLWITNMDYEQKEDYNGNFSAYVTYNSIFGQKLSSNISGKEVDG